MKITSITIEGFRAFNGPFEIDLNGGKNLLLYGENGSGKSSIYLALMRFFEERGDDIANHRNRFSPDTRESRVHVRIEGTDADGNDRNDLCFWDVNDGHPLPVPKDPSTEPIPQELRSLLVDGARRSGFLDYRMMLRTSLLSRPLPRSNDADIPGLPFQAGPKALEEQLFDLVALVILAGVPITTGGGDVPLGHFARMLWAQRPASRREKDLSEANAAANAFNSYFNAILPGIQAKLAEFLEYFGGHQLSIEFRPVSVAWDKPTLTLQGARLIPDITFRGQPISDYHDFLNEARLSALATCLFLAGVALSDNDYDNPSHPRFLVLDDAMIGLDLQNRLPILRILKSETFKHYQVFLFTYDRHWFEIAKRELGDGWLKAELYEGEDAAGRFEPILITPSLSNLERADRYFRRKDYAACANYLRKVCEEEACRILPEYRRRRVSASGEIDYARNLEELHGLLIAFLEENGVDPQPYRILSVVKAAVLNPFSHADMSSPLYTSEVQAVFDLVHRLRGVRRETIAQPEQELSVLRKSSDGHVYTYIVQLKEPLYALAIGAEHRFTRCESRPRRFFKGEEELPPEEKDDRLDRLYAHYCHHCNIAPATPYEDFMFPNGKSLQDRKAELFGAA